MMKRNFILKQQDAKYEDKITAQVKYFSIFKRSSLSSNIVETKIKYICMLVLNEQFGNLDKTILRII